MPEFFLVFNSIKKRLRYKCFPVSFNENVERGFDDSWNKVVNTIAVTHIYGYFKVVEFSILWCCNAKLGRFKSKLLLNKLHIETSNWSIVVDNLEF